MLSAVSDIYKSQSFTMRMFCVWIASFLIIFSSCSMTIFYIHEFQMPVFSTRLSLIFPENTQINRKCCKSGNTSCESINLFLCWEFSIFKLYLKYVRMLKWKLFFLLHLTTYFWYGKVPYKPTFFVTVFYPCITSTVNKLITGRGAENVYILSIQLTLLLHFFLQLLYLLLQRKCNACTQHVNVIPY